MNIWEYVLLIAVAGMFVLVVRRIPSAYGVLKDQEPEKGKQPEVLLSDKKKLALPHFTMPSINLGQIIAVIQRWYLQMRHRAKLKPRVTEDVDMVTEDDRSVAPLKSLPTQKEKPLAIATKIADEDVTEREGELAFRAHDYPAAAQIYETLVRRDGQNPKLYTRLGMIYMELERFHDARDIFRTALKFGEDVAARQAHLAMAEYALGHRVTAVRYIKRAIALSPRVAQYQQLLETFESND